MVRHPTPVLCKRCSDEGLSECCCTLPPDCPPSYSWNGGHQKDLTELINTPIGYRLIAGFNLLRIYDSSSSHR